jgi:hypothetical protein
VVKVVEVVGVGVKELGKDFMSMVMPKQGLVLF